MKKVMLVLPVIFLLLFFAGVMRHDVMEEKYLKLGAEPQFDCVGQVFKDTAAAGSCVLIGDRYVLSAMHVFVEQEFKPETVNHNGKSYTVNTPVGAKTGDISTYDFQFKGKRYSGKKLHNRAEYFDHATQGSYDIVFIELSASVKGIIPATLNTEFDELHAEVTGVGYGASGKADKATSVGLFNKKIAGENIVDSIGGLKMQDEGTKLYCDFDSPHQKNCNKTGSEKPCALEYICSGGDSGGGLFRKTETGWQLVGICAGSGVDIMQFQETGYYGQIMSWTRVSVFTDWINQIQEVVRQ